LNCSPVNYHFLILAAKQRDPAAAAAAAECEGRGENCSGAL